MLEILKNNQIFIGDKRLDQLVNGMIQATEEQKTYYFESLDSAKIDEVESESQMIKKIFFTFNQRTNLKPVVTSDKDKYYWYGLYKNSNVCSIFQKDEELEYFENYRLSDVETSYLEDIWIHQYSKSAALNKKSKKIKKQLIGRISRFQNYKDHFIVKRNGIIVAHMAFKYFYYPMAGCECSAIHLWIDESESSRKSIHQFFSQFVDKVHSVTPMFCGVSYDNDKALRSAIKYGFTPFFLEIKKYE